MRLYASLAGAIAVALTLGAAAATAEHREYFSESEIDRLRDAQGLEFRAPLYLRMADKRLVALGIKQLTEKEREAMEKADAKLDAHVFQTTGRAPIQKKSEDPDGFLLDYSKAQLLRGYVEAIDDLMSFIEDNFNRKVDVRPQLELLEKYVRTSRPLLDAFKPRNDAEDAAIEEAVAKTEEALKGAVGALEMIAPTEKKAVAKPKP